MDGWIDGSIGVWMQGDVYIYIYMQFYIIRWMDRRMMCKEIDGWMDGWMDG